MGAAGGEKTAAVERGVKGLTIGIPKEYRMDGMPEEIETLWQRGIHWLKSEGATVRDISLPHTKYALPAYYIVAPAEASSNLARYDGIRYGLSLPADDIKSVYTKTRAAGFGPEVRRRIILGSFVLSFEASVVIPGLVGEPGNNNTVDERDLVLFTPSSLGGTTAGTFTFLFDGNDVGLTTTDENIDALDKRDRLGAL